MENKLKTIYKEINELQPRSLESFVEERLDKVLKLYIDKLDHSFMKVAYNKELKEKFMHEK